MKGIIMRIVDLLPESFIESDFVTNQRLKYESSPKHQKIVHATAFATGAVLSAAAMGVMYVGLKKLETKLNESN
jgi:hypothetical protein